MQQFRCWAVAMAAVGVLAVSAGPAAANGSATGGVAVPPGSCTAPAIPPAGTPLEVDPATVAAPSGSSQEASRRAWRQVLSGLANFVACANDGRAVTLFTAHFVRDFMHQEDYADAESVVDDLRIDKMRVYDVREYEDGSFTAEVRYLAYGHRLAHELLSLWPDSDGYLKVNDLHALPSDVPRRSVEVRVEMGEYFFHLDKTRFCAPSGAVVLRLYNVGQERHEAILWQLPEGATAEDVFDGTVPREQVVTIAHENGADEISLIRMRPGTYTLLDFVAAPSGVPHVFLGQTAQFTILPRRECRGASRS